MQNAKDTFYIALRTRLAALNPLRVIMLRGVERPGILVEEAESPIAHLPNDVFVLRWAEAAQDEQLPLILTKLTCEVLYATSGSSPNGGLDRGRAISRMDEELAAITAPPSTPKFDYSQTPAKPLESIVFWSAPTWKTLETKRDGLSRAAKLTVFSFEEQGEL